VSYTYQTAKGTGSDPDSYLRTASRGTTAVLGERVDPPQAILPLEDNRTHNINGALSLTFPGDFQAGALSPVVRDLGAFLRFRFVSGLPYTRLINGGQGQTAPFTNWGLSAQQAEPINASTMPWQQQLDLRLTKGLRMGSMQWTAYADFRNLLNLTVTTALFAETGDVKNDLHRLLANDSEVNRLILEADEFAVEQEDGTTTIMLPTDCNQWAGGAVNCVLLRRAEQRWGDGDGAYTEAEYMTALNADYDLTNASYYFYGSGRQVRLGLELRF
jgi:hypothetical protein